MTTELWIMCAVWFVAGLQGGVLAAWIVGDR